MFPPNPLNLSREGSYSQVKSSRTGIYLLTLGVAHSYIIVFNIISVRLCMKQFNVEEILCEEA